MKLLPATTGGMPSTPGNRPVRAPTAAGRRATTACHGEASLSLVDRHPVGLVAATPDVVVGHQQGQEQQQQQEERTRVLGEEPGPGVVVLELYGRLVGVSLARDAEVPLPAVGRGLRGEVTDSDSPFPSVSSRDPSSSPSIDRATVCVSAASPVFSTVASTSSEPSRSDTLTSSIITSNLAAPPSLGSEASVGVGVAVAVSVGVAVGVAVGP